MKLYPEPAQVSLFMEGYTDLGTFEKLVLRMHKKFPGDIERIAHEIKQRTEQAQDPVQIQATIERLVDLGLAEPSEVKQTIVMPQDKIAMFATMLEDGYTPEDIATLLQLDVQIVRDTMEEKDHLVPKDYARRIDSRKRSIRAVEWWESEAGQAAKAARSGPNWYEWLKQFPPPKRAGIIAKTVIKYDHPIDKTLEIIQKTLYKAELPYGLDRAKALLDWAGTRFTATQHGATQSQVELDQIAQENAQEDAQEDTPE